jgi:hypothetical protein
MSKIEVERENMNELMERQVTDTDAIDTALGAMPGAVDGGIASAMIAFLASAAAESSGLVADSYRALVAITNDVLADVSLSEEQVADDLDKVTEEIAER